MRNITFKFKKILIIIVCNFIIIINISHEHAFYLRISQRQWSCSKFKGMCMKISRKFFVARKLLVKDFVKGIATMSHFCRKARELLDSSFDYNGDSEITGSWVLSIVCLSVTSWSYSSDPCGCIASLGKTPTKTKSNLLEICKILFELEIFPHSLIFNLWSSNGKVLLITESNDEIISFIISYDFKPK